MAKNNSSSYPSSLGVRSDKGNIVYGAAATAVIIKRAGGFSAFCQNIAITAAKTAAEQTMQMVANTYHLTPKNSHRKEHEE